MAGATRFLARQWEQGWIIKGVYVLLFHLLLLSFLSLSLFFSLYILSPLVFFFFLLFPLLTLAVVVVVVSFFHLCALTKNVNVQSRKML